jgi:hypothetical protein
VMPRYAWGVDRNRGADSATNHIHAFEQRDVTAPERQP